MLDPKLRGLLFLRGIQIPIVKIGIPFPSGVLFVTLEPILEPHAQLTERGQHEIEWIKNKHSQSHSSSLSYI